MADTAASTATRPLHQVRRIVVRVQVGSHRLAASDDPLFLGLEGESGRELRLEPAHGTGLRRGSENEYVLAGPDDPDTNVKHPELNDPAAPPLDASRITGVYIRKELEPIPNVRGFSELDDRLLIDSVEVELHAGDAAPLRFARSGPLWLGLVCGLRANLSRAGA